jgi:HlyD family secretion protein
MTNDWQRRTASSAMTMAAALVLSGCTKSGPNTFQGYVEGEFVHVAPGVGGRLERLLVKRGQTVEANTALFDLESTQEAAALRQADETLRASKSQLADLGTGKRSTEIEVTRAQIEQARAAERQSAAQVLRDEAQLEAGGISRAQVEASRARHEIDAARVRELDGQLKVAEEGARPDQINAQSAQVAAAHAAVDQTRWRLDEKHAVAKQAGLVVDTLYREGEWVPAGYPVVRMLPPTNVKVRFFVPQPSLSLFPVGGSVMVACDGCGNPIPAAVSYVSTEPEYTPPVIYSNEMRAKLVFMIEARPSAEAAPRLRPGQPVEVAHP